MEQRIDLEKAAAAEAFGALAVGADDKHRNAGAAGGQFTPAQIKRFTDLENEAVAKAAREFLRVIQLRELKAASGTFDYEDAGSQMEALELRERRLNQ